MELIKCHSSYLWNVQLLNRFGVTNWYSATCEGNIALEQNKIVMKNYCVTLKIRKYANFLLNFLAYIIVSCHGDSAIYFSR